MQIYPGLCSKALKNNFKKLLTNKTFGVILYLLKDLKAMTKTVLKVVFRELTLGASQQHTDKVSYHFRAEVLKFSVSASVIAA